MKKEELKALGITDSAVIREIQAIHGKDMEKLKQKILSSGEIEADKTREAIKSMIAVLESPGSLEKVLNTAVSRYHFETVNRKKAGETTDKIPTSEQPATQENKA